MTAAAWNSLEVAKLLVAALVPISVLLLGWPITRAVRRFEEAQWQNRKLVEMRLDLYAKMAGPLDDLFCFFRRVGDFQDITPPEALTRKRMLDKAFFVNHHLMTAEFGQRYKAFIEACFRVYTGVGRPAPLRASRRQQRVERPEWKPEWDDLLIPESETPTGLAEIEARYEALMESVGEEIGVRARS